MPARQCQAVTLHQETAQQFRDTLFGPPQEAGKVREDEIMRVGAVTTLAEKYQIATTTSSSIHCLLSLTTDLLSYKSYQTQRMFQT